MNTKTIEFCITIKAHEDIELHHLTKSKTCYGTCDTAILFGEEQSVVCTLG